MKTKIKRTTRTTEITVERDEVRVIRRIGQRKAWCPECECDSDLMTPEEAIAVAGISRGTLSDWMSAGRGHYVEANTVVLLICLESIDGVKDKDWKGVR